MVVDEVGRVARAEERRDLVEDLQPARLVRDRDLLDGEHLARRHVLRASHEATRAAPDDLEALQRAKVKGHAGARSRGESDAAV